MRDLPGFVFYGRKITILFHRKLGFSNCVAKPTLSKELTRGFTSSDGCRFKKYFWNFFLSTQDSTVGLQCTVKVDPAAHLIYWRAEDKVSGLNKPCAMVSRVQA